MNIRYTALSNNSKTYIVHIDKSYYTISAIGFRA